MRESRPVPQVAGSLREPIVKPLSAADGILASYHWETEEDAHIFLYLTLALDPQRGVGIAQTNVDSEQVRGQGDALWAFIGAALQTFSEQGFSGHGPCPIIHEVKANECSQRLPSSDPRYVAADGMKFYGLFLPGVAAAAPEVLVNA